MRVLTYDDFQKGLLYEDYADYVDYDRGVVVKENKIVEKDDDDREALKSENKELKKVCFALTVFSLFLLFCFFATR